MIQRALGRGWHRAVWGPKGDSYDNALAETINGLYVAEVIHHRGARAANLRLLGLLTRFAALGVLAMTAVIQLFVYLSG